MNQSTQINPTFLLKGCKLDDLIYKYNQGYFNRPFTFKKNIKISNRAAIMKNTYGTDASAPIYCVKDRNNCNMIIATTDHKNYSIFDETGGILPKGGECKLCGKRFEHQGIGYPVHREEKVLLITDSYGNKRYWLVYVFWTRGNFCNIKHMYKYVCDNLSNRSIHRDDNLRDCIPSIQLMYKLMYPDRSFLKIANDPDLLKSNGGSLSDDDYEDDYYVYRKTDRLILFPAKSEYLRQNFILNSSN